MSAEIVDHGCAVVIDVCVFKSKLVMQILQDMRTITAGRSGKLLENYVSESLESNQ